MIQERRKSLFYDQLLQEPQITKGLREELKRCVVVEASNVSDYYYCGTNQEIWNLAEDFPNIAPPFKDFFLEFHAPAQIISKEHGTQAWDADSPLMWGLYCQAVDMYEVFQTVGSMESREELHYIEEQVRTFISVQIAGIHNQVQCNAEILSDHEPKSTYQHKILPKITALMKAAVWEDLEKIVQLVTSNTRWHLKLMLFWKVKQGTHQRNVGPLWFWRIPINPEGLPVQDARGSVLHLEGPLGPIKEGLQKIQQADNSNFTTTLERLKDVLMPMLHTALLSISFMHCKNVQTSEITPPPPPLPTKRQIRWGQQPRQLATYHVLNIEPMKQILKTEGQSEKIGLQRALHICRGHFAHYTDKGLFGKYYGTFWKPQHIRGSQHAGIVDKDYRIQQGKKPK